MSAVDADPEELEKFASQLTELQRELEDAMKKTQRAFLALGWKDRERNKFEQDLTAALRSIRAASAGIEPLPKKLRSKASALREFQRR